MSSSWMTLLLLNFFLLLTHGYKLPPQYHAYLTSINSPSLPDPGSPQHDTALKFEWKSPNTMIEGSYMLHRVKRESSTDPSDVLNSTGTPIKTDATAFVEDTTPSDETQSPFLISEKQTISIHEDKTTLLPTSQDNLLTEVTTEGLKEASSFGNIQTTAILPTTNPEIMSTRLIVEDVTSVVPSEVSSNPPAISTVMLVNLTTELLDSTARMTDPSTTARMTDPSTTARMTDPSTLPKSTVVDVTASTEQPHSFHSLMKQCMLAILILAVICTIFIISTIVLAAKLSTMRHHRKKQEQNHTEMMCISTLLPESDQQSRVKLKKLRTFAANVEESDGDNTTLNSFLPDH